ncbi:MAG TPA: GntR family transcriptional regulator [Candidatus Micrarchaeia archaeon]|nr:GntR family transcriptional regulator [Candidatus Micrarchaeia archaeon]
MSRAAGRPLAVGQRRSRRGGAPSLRYEQVIDLIERLIAEGPLAPGSLLPSNRELAEMAGVSLITVRRAVDECARAGLVVRHQGVGTFVAPARLVSDPARAGGLLHTLAPSHGRLQVTTRVLATEEGIPSPTIARVLRISPSEPVWKVERLRLIRARPMIYEQAVIPVRLAPEIDHAVLAAGASLYAYLGEHHGLHDESEEAFLEVSEPSRRERRLLQVPPGDLVARVRGVSCDQDGLPFDAFQQVYAARHFAFYLSGQTTRHLLQSTDIRDWEVRPLGQVPEGPPVTGAR